MSSRLVAEFCGTALDKHEVAAIVKEFIALHRLRFNPSEVAALFQFLESERYTMEELRDAARSAPARSNGRIRSLWAIVNNYKREYLHPKSWFEEECRNGSTPAAFEIFIAHDKTRWYRYRSTKSVLLRTEDKLPPPAAPVVQTDLQHKLHDANKTITDLRSEVERLTALLNERTERSEPDDMSDTVRAYMDAMEQVAELKQENIALQSQSEQAIADAERNAAALKQMQFEHDALRARCKHAEEQLAHYQSQQRTAHERPVWAISKNTKPSTATASNEVPLD